MALGVGAAATVRMSFKRLAIVWLVTVLTSLDAIAEEADPKIALVLAPTTLERALRAMEERTSFSAYLPLGQGLESVRTRGVKGSYID